MWGAIQKITFLLPATIRHDQPHMRPTVSTPSSTSSARYFDLLGLSWMCSTSRIPNSTANAHAPPSPSAHLRECRYPIYDLSRAPGVRLIPDLLPVTFLPRSRKYPHTIAYHPDTAQLILPADPLLPTPSRANIPLAPAQIPERWP